MRGLDCDPWYSHLNLPVRKDCFICGFNAPSMLSLTSRSKADLSPLNKHWVLCKCLIHLNVVLFGLNGEGTWIPASNCLFCLVHCVICTKEFLEAIPPYFPVFSGRQFGQRRGRHKRINDDCLHWATALHLGRIFRHESRLDFCGQPPAHTVHPKHSADW